jgi:zinc D-Ala-D-Ala dipeptidase
LSKKGAIVNNAGARKIICTIAGFLTLVAYTNASNCGERPDRNSELPSPLVYLRTIDPTILQDIRYATPNNFTGQRVPGYNAAECVLVREVAEALAEVQADLRSLQLSLKVYDCYRPESAVRAFVAWVNANASAEPSRSYYPRLTKSELLAQHYIAELSTHSRGIAVDLTMVPLAKMAVAPFHPTVHYGPCTGPVKKRSPDNSLDMGTGFDCFDPRSYTVSSEITSEQRKARQMLVDLMTKHGFKNYAREWWHFTYQYSENEQQFDVPIEPLAGDLRSSVGLSRNAQ